LVYIIVVERVFLVDVKVYLPRGVFFEITDANGVKYLEIEAVLYRRTEIWVEFEHRQEELLEAW
jgi:hypothetical protein